MGEPNRAERPFWGWCECECVPCQIGDHHFCPDTKLCRMPKTYARDEMERKRAEAERKKKR